MTTIYRNELKTRILEKALTLFLRQGVRSVKMDDVAAALSISKRTLYELFANKEKLLFECVKYSSERREHHMEEFARQASSEMEIIMEAFRISLEEFSQVNPLFYVDAHKYAPVVAYLKKKHESRREQTLQFFSQCISKGYFRADVNPDLLTRLGDGVVEYVMQSKMYEQFPMKEIFRSMVNLFVGGLCTDKGLQELKKLYSGSFFSVS